MWVEEEVVLWVGQVGEGLEGGDGVEEEGEDVGGLVGGGGGGGGGGVPQLYFRLAAGLIVLVFALFPCVY